MGPGRRKNMVKITKTFKVKANTFRKLDDPFENGKSKNMFSMLR